MLLNGYGDLRLTLSFGAAMLLHYVMRWQQRDSSPHQIVSSTLLTSSAAPHLATALIKATKLFPCMSMLLGRFGFDSIPNHCLTRSLSRPFLLLNANKNWATNRSEGTFGMSRRNNGNNGRRRKRNRRLQVHNHSPHVCIHEQT